MGLQRYNTENTGAKEFAAEMAITVYAVKRKDLVTGNRR
jgi:hypothetical protein